MSEAAEIIAQIRLDLKPLEQKIVQHAYVSAIEEGRITGDQLKFFACQQYHIIGSDVRSVALLLARHAMLPSRGFLLNAVQGEAAALDALRVFASALGLSINELEHIEPMPAAHAYCSFVAWLALYGSDAELAAAFLINFAAWGANCKRISKALRDRYGFDKSILVFFDLFANLPPFESEALNIIQSGLDRGLPARLIHRAARMLQAYELMYWDTMAAAADIQPVAGKINP